jgi:hypothetical protein
MQTSFETNGEDRQLIITVSGDFDLEKFEVELHTHWKKVVLEGHSLLANMLVDIRKADVSHLSHSDLVAYAIKPRQPVPPKCLAILVSTEAQRVLAETYTAARYFTRRSTPNKVFGQLNEALAWIEEQIASQPCSPWSALSSSH